MYDNGTETTEHDEMGTKKGENVGALNSQLRVGFLLAGERLRIDRDHRYISSVGVLQVRWLFSPVKYEAGA